MLLDLFRSNPAQRPHVAFLASGGLVFLITRLQQTDARPATGSWHERERFPQTSVASVRSGPLPLVPNSMRNRALGPYLCLRPELASSLL